MPVYMIAMMSIHDPETYLKYASQSPPLVKRHGGKFLTRGNEVFTFEGDKYADRMVILEFPHKENVDALFNDADYLAAREFRLTAATTRVLVQTGVVNTENPDPNV